MEDNGVDRFFAQVEQRPENFRTMAALQQTMSHLRAIMDRTDVELVNIHKFLWDRFRGVRQDLFVQGIEVCLTCLLGSSALYRIDIHVRWCKSSKDIAFISYMAVLTLIWTSVLMLRLIGSLG